MPDGLIMLLRLLNIVHFVKWQNTIPDFTSILHFHDFRIYNKRLNSGKYKRKGGFMIYCIEDDSAIRDLIIYTLQASGFEAQGFESSAGFWPAMKKQMPELVILDVMLPREDGLTILRKLRSSPVTADIPVIMATAKDSEYDKITGLDSGADDYLAKPFGMMEMVSRIRAVLRRTGSRQPVLLTCGIILLDEGKHRVTVNGSPLFLTLKEYEL